MNRRHLFGLVAAAFVAPFVKTAPPTRRPFAFTMGEHAFEMILPTGRFEWKNVPGYASSGYVSKPMEITVRGIAAERLQMKDGDRVLMRSLVKRLDDLSTNGKRV